MLISLDFDGTFTRDPDGWRSFVEMMKERGHSFVCVTGRAACTPAATEAAKALSFDEAGPIMPIVFAGYEWKRTVAEKMGFKIDVWIDDCPTMIEKQYIL